MKNPLVIVPFRAGSKRIKNKNKILLRGIPLYEHTFAQASRLGYEVVCSSDYQDVEDVARSYGIEFLRRSEHLARDVSTMEECILDVLNRKVKMDREIILLQVTSPLRLDQDIHDGLQKFSSGLFDLVMSVRTERSSVLKSFLVSDDHLVPIGRKEWPFENEQVLPRVVKPNGAVYVFSSSSFLENRGFPKSKIGYIEMPAERSTDIDTLKDFQIVEQRF